MRQEIKMLTNAEVIAETLKKNGVEYIFGQSNPSIVTLESIKAGIAQIAYRQENTGSYMAQGYGNISGKVPVVTAQNGPAATLLVAGLAECLKASHPIVAIVQQVALKDYNRNAFQEMDHVKLFEGCSKAVYTITARERIEDFVDMAFREAAGGRPGPVVLLCPVDIINDKNQYEVTLSRHTNLGNYPLDRPLADPDQIKKAAEMLANAERPLIFAGGGVKSSRCIEELRAIQEKYAIPVATTMMGKGTADDTHPLTLGVIGYSMGKRSRTRFMRDMVEQSDVILLVGNRTNQNGTDSWTLLPDSAEYIHIDCAAEEIGRNYDSLRLCGDAKRTLQYLDHELEKLDMSKRNKKRSGIEAKIKDALDKHSDDIKDAIQSEQSPIRIERFLYELDKRLDRDHIIVSDASQATNWIANGITSKEERTFLFPRGLAGLGWGAPMCMGAKLAAPERKVFSLSGDGGFAHVWSELETCKRHGINVVMAVINNRILGYQLFAELQKFDMRFTNACELEEIDYVKAAEAFGAKGIAINTVDDIVPAIEKALAVTGQTVVLDIKVDPNCVSPVSSLIQYEGFYNPPQIVNP
jgi:acetolactate synthase-1/2/3 large subunit